MGGGEGGVWMGGGNDNFRFRKGTLLSQFHGTRLQGIDSKKIAPLFFFFFFANQKRNCDKATVNILIILGLRLKYHDIFFFFIKVK